MAEMLPGANCGACGLPGCRAFAEQAVAGEGSPASCNVADDDCARSDRELSRRGRRARPRKSSRGCSAPAEPMSRTSGRVSRPATCAAAAAVAGGGKGCAWGCLGLADCERSCDFGAITMNADGCRSSTSTSAPRAATASRRARRICSRSTPLDHRPAGAVPEPHRGRRRCWRSAAWRARPAASACIDAAHRLDQHRERRRGGGLRQNRARRVAKCGRCPTGAIVWLTGAQFAQRAGTWPGVVRI